MEDKNYNKDYDIANERIVNAICIDEIILAVKTNMPFTQYYKTYVDTRVDLKVNNKCICPMHDETEPSFRYFTETDTFACFGKCHVAGDVIRFHQVYLKHLIKTGQINKYNSITTLKPNDITYYTALQDLVNILKLTQLPNVFIENTDNKVVTQEELYNYFTETREELALTESKLTTNYIENKIIANLKMIKGSEKYKPMYKRYVNILTNGYDNISNREDLENLNSELEKVKQCL